MDQLFGSSGKHNAQEISFEDKATFLSKFLMVYMNPLFIKGHTGNLTHEDLGPVSKQDEADRLYRDFVKHWERERLLPKKKRSLWRVLWKTSGYGRLIYGLMLYASYTALSFGPVLILNVLTQYLQGTRDLNQGEVAILVILLFLVPMLASIFAAQSNVIMAHIGVQFRNALISMIYRKALRLSPSARQTASTGQIVNMFSNDTAQLQRFLFFMNNVCLAPIQIAVSLALIYLQVGPATFVGLGLLVILMPMNGIMFRLLGYFRSKKVKVTDMRVKLMNEILSGIRVIKNYAWERAFEKKVTEIRDKELIILKQLAYIVAIGFTVALMAAPTMQPVVIFYTYVRLGNQLDAAKIFTSISLFNLMQMPFAFLPLGLAQYSQSLVSSKRMLDFFVAEELEPYVDRSDQSDGVAILMSNVNANWVKEDHSTDESKKPDNQIGHNTNQAMTGMLAGRRMMSVALPSKRGFEAIAKDEEKVGDAPLHRATNTLMDINVTVKKGQLVAVVGPVGSGKSSFLNALLGELHLKSGSVRVAGSVSYCDQKPWILNATVRDNILFGRPYNSDRFDMAIHAASMEDDIRILPGGILTEIGEKGINLSGGQKARVALARAVYCDSDVYFLDDPLSAVDAHVGQHIFQECIKKALGKKTRILVTHHVHLLPQCDLIVVLEDGKVKAYGSYDEISHSGLDVNAIIPQINAIDESSEAIAVTTPETEANDSTSEKDKDGRSSKSNPEELMSFRPRKLSEAEFDEQVEKELVRRKLSSPDLTESKAATGDIQAIKELSNEYEAINASNKISSKSISTSAKEKEALTEQQQKATERKADNRSSNLMTVEEKKLGDVSPETYTYYIRAGGFLKFFSVVILLIAGQGVQLGSSFWLSYWGNVSLRRDEDGDPLSTSRNIYFLNIYAALSGAFLGIYMLRSICLANHRLGTSVGLHANILSKVLGASVAFFDVTPLGRILNRFSSDLLTVDEELSQTISQVTNSLFSCIGALAAIAASTKGTFLALIVPLIFVYNYVQTFFRKTNTTVARMESISRSPIYADFSQALTGLVSIRAYHEEDRFVHHLEGMVNRNTIANITSQNASQWLAVRLDFLGSVITFFIALIAVVTPRGFIPAGYMALGLAYSFQLTTFLKFAVRMTATLEAQMNSVERLMYYIENIEQEGKNSVVPVEPIPSDWPSEGAIVGRDVQMRYRDGPLVLKGINFDINPHEKIGIAGRTGSGKSSMMIALFRIQELAGGEMFIDGINLASVPLHILRSKIGIIPQDPVMFSATIRFNLDPFNEHSDNDLWEVLESVNMKEHVLSLPGKLLEDVAEGGDNFSAGQRQLICIARALLRHPKILVLDEATASIDNETDAMVQVMVREQFKKSTVLTIAHRLHTIIDSDRIMVLDEGRLEEYDAPQTLLNKESGLFKTLWDRHQTDHK